MAPPGMGGIKTGDRVSGLARSDMRPSLNKGSGDVAREFKGLTSGQSKDRRIDR